MKQTIILFVLLLVAFIEPHLAAQPYAIGNRSVTFIDPARSNRSIATTIYYPATTAGSNQPFATGTFPVVVFGHGFSMGIAAFTNIRNFLAPQGYVVVMVNTETGLTVSHPDFGQDLAFCVAAMQSENGNTGSPFFGKLTNKTAIMGHSMGGGCSFLAAANNPLVTTVVGLAPAETNPSAAAAAANVSVPILILAGENDCVTPAADHNLLIYNGATTSSCKYRVVIKNGIHCDFTNGDGNIPFLSPAFNCYFGGSTCGQGNGSSSGQATQQARMEAAVLPWLEFRLKSDCAEWATFQNIITNTDSYSSFQQNCIYTLPTASITPPSASLCTGNGSAALTADGAGSNGTYAWLASGGGAIEGAINTAGAVATAAGTYSVTVTDVVGCTDTEQITIAGGTAPTVNIAPTTASLCSGNVTALTASGGNSYTWSASGGGNITGMTNTASVTATAAGTYTVTVTGSNGCTNTAERIVTTGTAPTVTITPATASLCSGGTIALVSSGGGTYAWSASGGGSIAGANNGIAITAATAGTYTVTVTGSNGCTNTAERIVTTGTAPTVTITPATASLCSGGTIALVSSGGGTYAWSASGGGSIAGANNGIAITAATAGIYTVTVTGANGCTTTEARSVSVIPPLMVSIVPALPTVCEGGSTILTVSGGAAYQWSSSGGGVILGANNAASVTITAVGNYTVTVTDGTGCTATATTSVATGTCSANLQAKVWLEGAYRPTILRMDTALRNLNLLPIVQPYNAAPWSYGGTENAGSLSAIPTGVTDWVLVELRRSSDTIVVAQKAVWLMNTGWLRELGSASNNVSFAGINLNAAYFISIRHRNHLDILSNNSLTFPASGALPLDFTQVSNVENGATQLSFVGTTFAMVAGDNDGNGKINLADFSGYVLDTPTGINNYAANLSDHDLNRVVNYRDFNVYYNNTGRNAINLLRY